MEKSNGNAIHEWNKRPANKLEDYGDENGTERPSVFVNDDWDAISEELIDDYDDFADLDFPTPDDDY